MNDELRARLLEHQDPDHECSPFSGACGLPFYRYNATLPSWLEQWPESSVAREKAQDLQEDRDWGEE